MNGLMFLDLDGTVRKTKSGDKFINDPHDQELITGVWEVCRYYEDKGWYLIGITNQGGVEKRFKSLENCIEEQRYTLKMLPYLRAIYFCPNFSGDICYRVDWNMSTDCYKITNPWLSETHSFRKPGIGMVKIALKQFNVEDETPKWLIGDSETDKQCANLAGLRFIWADVWRTRRDKGLVEVNLRGRELPLVDLKAFLLT